LEVKDCIIVLVKVSVVVPNWNGEKDLPSCLDSLRLQSQSAQIIVVDNNSSDNSVNLVQKKYPQVELIKLKKNKGFTGGVNAGIRRSIETGSKYVALLNSDAVAHRQWLKKLIYFLEQNPQAGIVSPKILDYEGKRLDSAGDIYTIWGLPYPRGRGEIDNGQYDNERWIFGASGAASCYRTKMLKEIGLFDEDFFAYYEDVDISFRAQLAGWKVAYVPDAIVYHQIGAASSKIKDFTAYQTLKNLPMLMWKNVPLGLLPKVWPRFELAYTAIALRTLQRRQFGAFFKGIMAWGILWPKKFIQRYKIQKTRKVSNNYLSSIIVYDLPPNAIKLRKVRRLWWKLRGKDADA
jgi:hypothetical protein